MGFGCCCDLVVLGNILSLPRRRHHHHRRSHPKQATKPPYKRYHSTALSLSFSWLINPATFSLFSLSLLYFSALRLLCHNPNSYNLFPSSGSASFPEQKLNSESHLLFRAAFLRRASSSSSSVILQHPSTTKSFVGRDPLILGRRAVEEGDLGDSAKQNLVNSPFAVCVQNNKISSFQFPIIMEDLEMEMGIAMAAGGEAEDMNFLINTTTTSNDADENGDVIGEQISVCDFSEEGIKAKLPPPEPEELLDSEFPDTEDLLNAAEIFDCVNLPAINELQQLPDCSAASISSSSASVSSPSSSWIPKKDPDAASGCCFATERPEDSATSTSLAVREIPDSDCVCYDNNDKIDLLEELRSLELLDGSEDVWDMPDSSCLQAVLQEEPCEAAVAEAPDGDDDSGSGEELPMVFFEWLKSNRDSISPEDLRNIKLKRSTIETAAQHLGGGKKGMLHLLKLILSWVQTYHLQRKRKLRESPPLSSSASSAGPFCYNLNFPVLLESASSSPAPAFACSNDPNIYDPTLLSCDPAALHAPKYRRVPMEDGLRDAGFENPNQISLQSCVGSDLSSWQMAMIAGNSASPGGVSSSSGFCNSTAAGSFMNGRVQHHHLSADFMGFRSATPAASTKEARKNRMARQRRSLAHHHHRPWQSSSSTCSSPAALAVAVSTAMNPHNPSPETVAANGGFPIMQQHFSQRQTAFMPSDRRQGWKPEKNLKFLLQKVLKQSDVGNLGRIVLPKKEAEAELPKLEARDGIPITMEDMTTSRVWSMRYRFWPNNKSRMYLLENTGDFVRSNNLQEGDFIVIFLDTKTGKYMIRGVKVPRSDATAVATTTTTNYSNNNTNSSNKIISSNHNSNSSSSNVICNSNSSGRACSRLPNVAPSKVAKANPSYGASTTQQSRHAIAPMPATAPAPAAATTALSVFADASSASGSHFHLSCNSSIVDPFFTDSSLQTQSQSDPAVSSPQTHDDSVGLERFPSIESEDLTIQEIMDLVDSPEDDDDDKELQAETP